MSSRGWENVTLSDIGMRAFPKQGKKAAGVPVAKRSKYRAIRCEVNGFTFDSKREAARYLELLARHVVISNLELQPRFPLKAPNGTVIGHYVADFRYQERRHRHGPDGEFDAWEEDVIEDVKGWRTLPFSRWKMKHFTAQYGLPVREIR